MTGTRQSRLLGLSAVILVLAVLVGVGVYYKRQLDFREQPTLSTLKEKKVAPAEPDPMTLSTVPISSSIRSQILAGDFSMVYRVADIPAGCEAAFESSFVTSSAAGAAQTKLQMADPGEAFNSSDNVTSGLAFRRLIFAGLAPKTCFIYYERGGSMYPSSCLAVMDYAQGKSIWVGESRKKAASLNDLRLMISEQQFEDTRRPVC
jgi:hypothetical protein